MLEYIIKKHKFGYDVFRIENELEILEKIFTTIQEVEIYITLKEGIIKTFDNGLPNSQ